MATIAAPATPDAAQTTAQTAASPSPAAGFLISPGYDLLLICNLYWPIVLLAGLWGGLRAHESLLFWQVFFVTTPHRWITLFLVFGDQQQLTRAGSKFYLLTAIIVGSVSLVYLSVGSLLCLVAIDYAWNAWHFAAQHHGIYRIYSRQSQGFSAGWQWVERWLFRGFILYVIARIAGWSWDYAQLTATAQFLDFPMLLIPATIVIGQLIWSHPRRWASLIYSVSVLTLFSALLLAVRWSQPQWILSLTLASALFHATEYLAIVSWSMQSEKTTRRGDLFGRVGTKWVWYLVVFMVILGVSGWMLEQGAFKAWAAINLAVAFMHYSFDGIIWKRPRTKQSAAVEASP